MNKEFIMATAKTIEQQILWSINKWEYLSWGISKKAAIEYEGMATLALRVSGAVHKGWVFISLNEGKDCYEVRLLNVARTKVKRTLEEVYCDNLGEVLDSLIERKSEWTDAQYKDKAVRDSARKMGMEVIDVSKNNSSNNKPTNKEDENMRLNINNNSETKNVQTAAQVTNPSNETIVSQVDVIGLMNGLKKNGTAKLSDYATPVVPDAAPVEDAHAEEVESVSVGEVTVDSIMPVMQPVEEKPEEKPAVTVPLGDHGTLVIAGVGSDKPKPEMPKRDASGKFLKKKTPQAETTTESKLSVVRLVTYKTKKGADAPMIVGFGGDDDPRWKKHFDAKPKWVSAGFRRDMESNKVCHLMFGAKYMDVAKALCDAYNTDDREAWAKAEQACADNYNGIVAGYQAEKAARRAAKQAEREAAKAAKAEQPTAPAMSSEEQAMFDLFKKFMSGDKEAMAKVNAVLKKAA